MRETKITVTIYSTSKQSFGSQGIYGDHVLVTSSGGYQQGIHLFFNGIAKEQDLSSYEQVLLAHMHFSVLLAE